MSQDEKFYEGFETPPSNWIQWGEIGDVIKGTLSDVSERDGKYGKQKVYEIIVDFGEYHLTDEDGKSTGEKVEIKQGEIYNVGGRATIDRGMRRADIGQKVIVEYEADFKAEKGKAKTITVKLGAMDEKFGKSEEPDIPFDN